MSQNEPALQAPAPGQHTPPSGAQLNPLGHRKKPGLPGQGVPPPTALKIVPGGRLNGVLGGTFTKTMLGAGRPAPPPPPGDLPPPPPPPGPFPPPPAPAASAELAAANVAQSLEPVLSVAFKM